MEQRNHLLLKAQLKPGKRYSDGSVGINFVTAEEIGIDKFAEIDSYRQQNGWLAFFPNEFDISSIPTENAEDEGSMKLWERQQKAIYKLFMLEGGSPKDFGPYYREQMEKFMSVISEQIEIKEGEE